VQIRLNALGSHRAEEIVILPAWQRPWARVASRCGRACLDGSSAMLTSVGTRSIQTPTFSSTKRVHIAWTKLFWSNAALVAPA